MLGAELEWYVKAKGATQPFSPDAPELKAFSEALAKAYADFSLMPPNLEEERGPGQIEAGFPTTRDANALATRLAECKTLVMEVAGKLGLEADFSAKPFPGLYGSGMHIHVHLDETSGKAAFWKKEDGMSGPLAASLAGLLVTMEEELPVFAPLPASYLRFEKGFHAPVMACWGPNNRTVALRLPDMSPSPLRRIEHRVAGADADPYQVIAAILGGIHYGLAQQPPLPPAIHGDAGDAQYHEGMRLFADRHSEEALVRRSLGEGG